MDLDNEENYFTKRMNGAIKDKDVENAVEKILDIKKEYSTMDGLKEYVYAIETILNELKYVKAELERQINARMITEEVIEKNYIDRKEIKEIRDKLEVMDYYLSEEALEDLNKVLGDEE